MRSKVKNQTVKTKDKSKRKPDARVKRTRDQLGSALIQLIVEKPINDVTVQDVLDRSGVGRSTFYLHYRDKDDLHFTQRAQRQVESHRASGGDVSPHR